VKRPRSAAQAAASRRNGARSRGPQSSAARAASSRNAVKHGLFRTRTPHAFELTGSVRALSHELTLLAAGGPEAAMQTEAVLVAAVGLEEATAMVESLRAEIGVIISSAGSRFGELETLLPQLARMSRYQRRFRGRRDRMLRALVGAGQPLGLTMEQPR